MERLFKSKKLPDDQLSLNNELKFSLSGQPSQSIGPLPTSATIEVTSESGATRVYSVVLSSKVEPEDDDACLLSLDVHEGDLSPLVACHQKDYKSVIKPRTKTITLRPISTPGSCITINGKTVLRFEQLLFDVFFKLTFVFL